MKHTKKDTVIYNTLPYKVPCHAKRVEAHLKPSKISACIHKRKNFIFYKDIHIYYLINRVKKPKKNINPRDSIPCETHLRTSAIPMMILETIIKIQVITTIRLSEDNLHSTHLNIISNKLLTTHKCTF